MSVRSAAVELLVVGKDVDGSWTVRESAGVLLGRYASCQAAHRFAERERRARPCVSIASSAGVPARLHGRLSIASGRTARRSGAQDG